MIKRNIVHIEIPAENVAAAGKFYEAAFGWKITAIPDMNYTMWEPKAQPAGGFSALSEQVQPGDVLLYIDSQDIEADLKQIEALGGAIVMGKTEIPETGWFAVFTDPTGNRLALYTSMNPEFNA